ncbi:chemerin-like receptor 1 [Hyla sarda]|uniref:chemerin-like receptor 1 n=1 Tax=Hyla sarda TaxID=327740 RepID=UPI0024C2B3DE|nr:chemerin-like receptor 1 [Hyla sarda]
MNDELGTSICYLLWDIFNDPQLLALSPSTSHPTAVQFSCFVLSILTCIIGYVGNIIVIFVTAFLRKKNKSHVWFLNLAVADFIFLLLLPFHAVSILLARWPYGSTMCKVYNFYTFVNMYASIYILTALNIDRALAVAKPIWHLKFISRKFGYSVCTLIWLSSTICSIPAIIYSDIHYFGEVPQCFLFSDDLTVIAYSRTDKNMSEAWRSFPRNICDGSWEELGHATEWSNVLSTTTALVIPLAVIGCFIPLCVILTSNIVIALHVKNSQKTESSRLYRVVIAAMLAFFCTRVPLVLAQIIILVAAYTLELSLMFTVISVLPLLSSIAATNTFLNPIVYVLVGKQVKNEISQFFKKV